MLEIWPGCWVSPEDVLLVRAMGEDEAPNVQVTLKSGPSVIVKANSEKEAYMAASRIAHAVKEAVE